MASVSIPVYSRAVVATTNVNFSIGTADALLIFPKSTTCTVTLTDGTTVALGDVSGAGITFILPVACTKVVFDVAGSVIALKSA